MPHFIIFAERANLGFNDARRTLNLNCTKTDRTDPKQFGTAASGYSWTTNNLEHSTLVPPMKITTTHAETRWSKWVEYVSKGVECTFGILKGRCVRASSFALFSVPYHGPTCSDPW